jgi:periplasmic nitrate reductase NapD
MNDKIHISSLMVQLRPYRLEAISAWCSALDKAEVHATDPRGILILVLEASGQREIMNVIDRLREEAGVIDVSMVYHHVESAQELDREVSYEADAT